MRREKNGKNLKEKVLFLMCLGALAGNMSAGVYAQDSEVNYDKYYNIDGDKEIKDEIIISDGKEKEWGIFIDNQSSTINGNASGTISFKENVEIKKNNFGNSVYIQTTGGKDGTVKFEKNLIITNKLGYALYNDISSSSSAGSTTEVIVGDINNPGNKIQIIGKLRAKSVATSSYSFNSKIQLNLNGEESFFAGEMETEEETEGKVPAKATIELNLKDKATWYAQSDTYTIDESDRNLRTEITSDGGVIDIYHATPNKTYTEFQVEQLETFIKMELKQLDKTSLDYENKKNQLIEGAKGIYDYLQKNKKIGERTFTLNGVGDRLQNTTFRISSDVEKGKADKIVLNGIEVNKDKETYYIEIAADPFESGEWKATENDKILVMDINAENSNIDDLNKITVEGKECEAEIGAGLVKQKIIPTVEEDTNNKGDWYLTSIDKVENKGSGHIFAEIGAAANAGMASAWRTDSGDLYQRMGNLRNNEAEQGIWGRIYTGENEVRKGIGLDLEYRVVQVGYDRKENIDNGKLFTGIAFGYFDGNADYDHGSGESNSATFGVYATYSGNNGSFGDFIVKLGNIDNKLSYTSESGDYYKADYDTYGFSADGEYGYRYEFNNDYYIEPLVQLSYIYIADEEYTMNLNGESGAKVSNDDYQSLIGYTGFHYGKKFNDSVVYLRVAAAHEFAGDIDVNAKYQDIKVNSSISGEDTWVEYGVGFDVKVKEDTAVYGRVQRTTGDVVKNKWHASVGLRYTF